MKHLDELDEKNNKRFSFEKFKEINSKFEETINGIKI